MVSPIDPSNSVARLTALLRQARGATARPSGGRIQEAAAGSVMATLRQRLRAIAADSPRRQHAMARLLVETLLVDEFGGEAMNDAGFQVLVDEVVGAMEGHQAFVADLERVVGVLARGD